MKLKIKETAIFALLGAIMYASKVAMQFLPNIHIIAALITAYTICFRKKALYPIYIYIFLEGLFGGFTQWWIPYLYIWTILWGVIMLLPKNMKPKIATPVYMTVCSLHGLLFGTLFAPAQALLFGLDFKGTISWIAAGLPFDAIHGISNFFMALLVVPLVKLINRTCKDIL